MTGTMHLCQLERQPDFLLQDPAFSLEAAREARAIHQGIRGYAPTPLCALDSLARELGVEKILVKDESKRFGLNSFKGLGGSHAIARCLCRELGIRPGSGVYQALQQPEKKAALEQMTFVTATDGNHGRGVAWTARELGCRAVVYLPAGTAKARLQHILDLGAHGEITPWNYDDTVRYAKEMAEKQGWTLIQDTAWEGYEEIPLWIMQGYATMGAEILEQLAEMGQEVPTHLFLQAGVGSMAGAMAGFCRMVWKERCPQIIVVEPDRADCLFRTAQADDGRLHTVTGALDSMMAGLCCGEPCALGWERLERLPCAFVSCSDEFAAEGMRLLGRPCGSDPVIVSGESGAATMGAAAGLLRRPEMAEWKRRLGLDSHARILLLNTEGDTDPGNYARILGTK